MINNTDNRICQKADPVTRLRRLPFVAAMDRFLASPAYIFFIGILTVFANVFSAEFVMYFVCILTGLYLSFFGKDYLPLIPIFICCYISPSQNNNPGRHETSIFLGASGIFIQILVAVLLLSIIYRLATDPEIGKKAFWTCKRKLLPGILVLGIAYLLAGAGSGHYFDHKFNNAAFAVIQFIAVFLLYFLLTGAVKWDSAPRQYLAWTGICVGFVLLVEIANIYLTQNIIVGGEIQRSLFYTGWGHYNNMGALLTMMIPFPFQMACNSKKSWAWYLCAVAFFLGVMLTCSRVSTLIAIGVYVLSGLVIMSKSRNRRVGLTVNAITFGVIILVSLIFYRQLWHLFNQMFSNAMSFAVRLDSYKAGLLQFLDNPIFGGTFYPLDVKLYHWADVESFIAFIPPRWHNTIIQLAASCGIVGLVAYGYHRFQTIQLLLHKPSTEVVYIFISILALVLMSLLDCHFFNVGPVLFYSLSLAFAEKCSSEEI